MEYSSVPSLIAKINSDFSKIMNHYRMTNIQNEFYDDDYKDSEVNIFIETRYPQIMDLIKEYCAIKDASYGCKYSKALVEIKELMQNVNDYRKTVEHRVSQFHRENKKEWKSIIFFLNVFFHKLKFEIDLIEKCLTPFAEYVAALDDKGMTINEDPDYVLYYINKCVILSHSAFFRDDCINALSNVNKRVIGRNTFKSEMLFRLGTLNFNFHFYDEAKIIFKYVIEQLSREMSENNDADIIEKKYMFFSSYLMYVTSYEFTSDYIAALEILFGLEPGKEDNPDVCDRIISTFSNALKNNNKTINDLSFSTTDEEGKKEVIELLNIILDNNIFDGQIAEFAYTNGSVFRDYLKRCNSSFEKDFSLVCNKYKDCGISSLESKIKRVREHFVQFEELNKPMHDYLHILSHCLNEEATAVLSNAKEGYNEKTSCIILIARALMLFVSENDDYYHNASSYKTCFATVYAEAGDFSIANASLKEYVKSDDYLKLGVDSKAEIDFFYYLISRIDSINNGNADHVDDDSDDVYNHFINCCYRNFDFDAIAHISLLSIEYDIATILQKNSFINLGRVVSQDSPVSKRIRSRIKSIGNVGHNLWLSNERRKVNYMYQFLELFLNTNNNKYTRSPQVYEIASKYLYYSNINAIVESEQIPYLDYTEVRNLKDTIRKNFNGYSYLENETSQYYKLSIGNCAYISIKQNNNKYLKELGDEINNSQALFFVNATSQSISNIYDKLSHKCNGEETRVRMFSNEIDALKEFFLFYVFERIRNDFVSPNGLFVMTPVHNAEPCKYQVTDFIDLLSEVYNISGYSEYDEEDVHVQVQYEPSGINRLVLSKEWIRRIEPYKNDVLWITTLALMKRDEIASHQTYSYGRLNDEIKTAVLLNPKRCKDNLELLARRIALRHLEFCGNPNKRCMNNCYPIDLSDQFYTKKNKRFAGYINDLFHSMPEIQWKNTRKSNPNGTLVVWKGESGPYTIWRLIACKVPENEMDTNFLTKICNMGKDEPFQTTHRIEPAKWPIPYDISKNERFVFISHLVAASGIIKRELSECLERHHVRYWYDQELVVTEEWKYTINSVIWNKNCVGAILFITDAQFFRSESINYELSELMKKKEQEPDFSVIPVVYGCSEEKELVEICDSEYDNNSSQKELVKELIGIDNKDRKKIFLNILKGETLSEFEDKEKDIDGKADGALMYALRNLNVLSPMED